MISPIFLSGSLTVCICTYKRPELLKKLIIDIINQTFQCGILIIVDGDPTSGVVKNLLASFKSKNNPQFFYVPSNHANLAYQRYLAWKMSTVNNPEFIFYFDDDLRFCDHNTLSRLLQLLQIQGVVGVTAKTSSSDIDRFKNEPALIDRATNSTWRLNNSFSNRDKKPGGFLPSGNRIPPIFNSEGICQVDWLQGRVMAYRSAAIDQSCFSEDLFALTHIQCGLGEDTFLSRQVSKNGKLVITNTLNIEHPDDALPNSYPIKAYNLAYATAYSRRFLNDHYRITGSTQLTDRFALLNTYLGNNLINIGRALTSPRRHRFAYAWGYLRGSLRGLFQKPTTRNLTPQINWLQDAESALQNAIEIK